MFDATPVYCVVGCGGRALLVGNAEIDLSSTCGRACLSSAWSVYRSDIPIEYLNDSLKWTTQEQMEWCVCPIPITEHPNMTTRCVEVVTSKKHGVIAWSALTKETKRHSLSPCFSLRTTRALFLTTMMITMGTTTGMLAFLAMAAVVPSSAFTGPRPTTTIITAQQPQLQRVVLQMIDRNVADMIDQEYYRQHHKEEYHERWMVQHQSQLKTTTTTEAADTYHNDDNDDKMWNRRQFLRDEKLARTDPQQYCRDRCIATGYCDVYEDLYVLLRVLYNVAVACTELGRKKSLTWSSTFLSFFKHHVCTQFWLYTGTGHGILYRLCLGHGSDHGRMFDPRRLLWSHDDDDKSGDSPSSSSMRDNKRTRVHDLE